MTTCTKDIVMSGRALAMCSLASFFSYAQAQYVHVNFGADIESATVVSDTAMADVAEGMENYFKITEEHLPATVYYLSDSLFGPIPMLIDAEKNDTLPATFVSEQCKLGWKWELPVSEEIEEAQYLYFSSQETAHAQIMPFVCHPVHMILPEVSAYDMYTWLDSTIYNSGTYTRRYVKADGCDSLVTMSVVIRHMYKDTVSVVTCESQIPYMWYGRSLTQSGVYTTDTMPYADVQLLEPVDSLHTLVLTVNYATTGDTTAIECDEFTWHGTKYIASGDYMHLLTNAAGCDSIATLHLTIFHSTYSEETRSEYDSYTWNGTEYTQSGNYTYRTINAAGCDSVVTLHLTIIASPEKTLYDTVYFCEGFNTEHEERISETLIRRYLCYRYEAPSGWYKEGMVKDSLPGGMSLYLNRAEQNLRAYYTGALEPVERIEWSYRAYGEQTYETVIVSEDAQWFATGDLLLNVSFLCGHEYREMMSFGTTEGIEDVAETRNNGWQKVLIDGQLFIRRDEQAYDLLGRPVKRKQ